jgi:hypothetical protein
MGGCDVCCRVLDIHAPRHKIGSGVMCEIRERVPSLRRKSLKSEISWLL